MYDIVIIGSGPAGLTAGIYGKRAGYNTVILDKSPIAGGQILSTYEIDNYPGIPGVSGMELGEKLKEHAKSAGVEFKVANVLEIIDNGKVKVLKTKDEDIETKSVIIATGARHRMLGVPGEEELCGMGVSYCATCDGAFFKGRDVAVVGGGDVALEDALFLARTCNKVYLIHRRDEFRGAKILQEQVKNTDNIEVVYDSVVDEILGEDQIDCVNISNKKTFKKTSLDVAGIFIAVGISPNTEGIIGLPDLDEGGYIKADESGVTSIEGIFAAGDVRTKALRQVITACADGANSVTFADRFIQVL